MSDLTRVIAENLAEVRGRIAEAAARAGRGGDAIKLVAVTKYVGEDEIRALVAAGCTTLGENRPQALCKRAETFRDLQIQWHMIGHLQRNKVRRVAPLVTMIESVDSPSLLEAIDRIAGELGRRVPVLLEVNISGESQKHGLAPDHLPPLAQTLDNYPHVEVLGLMAMASLAGGEDRARADFAALRELRDRARRDCPAGVSLDELSIGMSGDFETAVEEGATIVRIGSALFEGTDR
ncbi:MAG TPA: YggS family pyridoxal phosphate-dependent enzyme [Thermoguttaceae bacterium]|nr:YggS family pyridoxal phosphate-dependent enzyme [Thermoguttaceae bacterium]